MYLPFTGKRRLPPPLRQSAPPGRSSFLLFSLRQPTLAHPIPVTALLTTCRFRVFSAVVTTLSRQQGILLQHIIRFLLEPRSGSVDCNERDALNSQVLLHHQSQFRLRKRNLRASMTRGVRFSFRSERFLFCNMKGREGYHQRSSEGICSVCGTGRRANSAGANRRVAEGIRRAEGDHMQNGRSSMRRVENREV